MAGATVEGTTGETRLAADPPGGGESAIEGMAERESREGEGSERTESGG